LTKKAKKGRPRSKNPMVHTAVVLPSDLIARLRKDAEAKGLGLSAEIRLRLAAEDLMHARPRDLETKMLLHAIRHLSDFLARDLGKRWHEHPYAMAAFKAGVADLLARYQLEGDESVGPNAQVVGDPPEVVGRTHARRIGIAGHETEDDYDPTNYYDETDPDGLNKRKPASNRKKMKD
jgi:hypothetical protein